MPFDYYPEFITSEEEAQILAKIYHCDAQWQQRFTERRMQTFGFQYIQGSTDVISVAAIPSEFDWILSKLTSLTKITFNQLTINEYKPGQGIDEHYDHKTRFGNQICGLTLGSGCEFVLKKIDGDDIFPIYLQPRSLYVMSDDERYNWTHKIKKVHSDVVNGIEVKRSTRVSLTFRYKN